MWSWTVSSSFAAAVIAATTPAAWGEEGSGLRWPREFEFRNGTTLVIHQPQVTGWRDFSRLEAIAAVSLDLPDLQPPLSGGVRLSMKTTADLLERVVVLEDIEVVDANFPSVEASSRSALREELDSVFPTGPMRIGFDRILSGLDERHVELRTTDVSREPPKVIMTGRRAFMVLIDGPPILREVEGTHLLSVANTSSVLLKHRRNGEWYLLWGNSWLHTHGLHQKWVPANSLPDAFSELPMTRHWSEARAHIPGSILSIGEYPDVHVSTVPTELIVTRGEPLFRPVPNTDLLYVQNTESDIFLSSEDGLYYMLLSGRWFKTLGKDYPLMYAGKSLPADFGRIPAKHRCGRVLASVPGTPQAREAVISSQIPRTARVTRAKASAEITYEGRPMFRRITGAEGVWAAENTSEQVFRMAGGYYACHEGVWFEAGTPDGPWTVCAAVAGAVYGIPATSPHYNVTFVRVSGVTDEHVLTQYEPGYLGSYVADGVVMYGTGHRHAYDAAHFDHRYGAASEQANGEWIPRGTYGAGWYYDHWNSRFWRQGAWEDALLGRGFVPDPYDSWRRSEVDGRYWKRALADRWRARGGRTSARVVGTPYRGTMDLYVAGRGMTLFRRMSSAWQQYDAGRWRAVDLPSGRDRAERGRAERGESVASMLERALRSREDGPDRSAHYLGYQGSRGAAVTVRRGEPEPMQTLRRGPQQRMGTRQE